MIHKLYKPLHPPLSSLLPFCGRQKQLNFAVDRKQLNSTCLQICNAFCHILVAGGLFIGQLHRVADSTEKGVPTATQMSRVADHHLKTFYLQKEKKQNRITVQNYRIWSTMIPKSWGGGVLPCRFINTSSSNLLSNSTVSQTQTFLIHVYIYISQFSHHRYKF